MIALFNIRAYCNAIGELIRVLYRKRQLTLDMTKREISERYAGQILGVIWAVLHPLVMMGIYVFIFAYVFKIRIGGTREMPLDYTTYLLSGLMPWMAFQESMNKATTAISSQANLVKQVVFPIEILPAKMVLATLLSQCCAMAGMIIYILANWGYLPWTLILLPVLLVFQVFAMIGVAMLFSSVAVFFRDLKDFVQVFCVMGMYLMPVFYLPQSVPALFKPMLYLNPFSYMTWCYQDCFYFGRFEHPWAWVIFPLLAVFTFGFGFRMFRKLRVLFGNVL